MTPEQWLYVSLLVLVASNLAAVLYAVHVRRTGGGEPATAGPFRQSPDPDDGADGTVTCRECGTENERGYRYCRRCVAELPGVPLNGKRAVQPSGGRTMR